MNFGNEIGHQIDINKNLFRDLNVAANLSLSYRHNMDDMESISFLDILSMRDEDKMYDYYPFRQIYLEMNGWALSDRLYYKIGVDNFTEFYKLIYQYKNDCLSASIEYNKDYYNDKDLNSTETIFFKLSILPFSQTNSPNLLN